MQIKQSEYYTEAFDLVHALLITKQQLQYSKVNMQIVIQMTCCTRSIVYTRMLGSFVP